MSQPRCDTKGCQSIGGFSRLRYDTCAYDRYLAESTSPLAYRLYGGQREHCKKCIHDKFYFKQDVELVDAESELKNITRASTKCPKFKYSPTCPKSYSCFNTFDATVPVSLTPEVCPIVFNNIPVIKTPGYEVPPVTRC